VIVNVEVVRTGSLILASGPKEKSAENLLALPYPKLATKNEEDRETHHLHWPQGRMISREAALLRLPGSDWVLEGHFSGSITFQAMA
jgi:hypothetical protein